MQGWASLKGWSVVAMAKGSLLTVQYIAYGHHVEMRKGSWVPSICLR